MKRIVIALLIFLVAAQSAFGLSASIGNAKAIIKTEVTPGEVTVLDRTIKVINVNDIPVRIHFVPQKDWLNKVEIIDQDVVLQPDEEIEARITISLYQPGSWEMGILVQFVPEDEEGQTPVGLKSSYNIVAEGPESDGYLPEPEYVEEEYDDDIGIPIQQTDNDEEPEEKKSASEVVDEKRTKKGLGGFGIQSGNPEEYNKQGPNHFVGIGIFVVIVLVGFGIMKLTKR